MKKQNFKLEKDDQVGKIKKKLQNAKSIINQIISTVASHEWGMTQMNLFLLWKRITETELTIYVNPYWERKQISQIYRTHWILYRENNKQEEGRQMYDEWRWDAVQVMYMQRRAINLAYQASKRCSLAFANNNSMWHFNSAQWWMPPKIRKTT